jgi:serine/threonine-protein kinase
MTNAPKPPPGPPSRPDTSTLGAAPALDAPDSATPPPSKVDAFVGKTIDGRYIVERILGEGGMGIVYAARHKVIGKRVAIKVLRGEMATDNDVNERFLQEARAASAIGNPHIIDISDFGHLPDGSTYFVMEFLDGKSLSQIVSADLGPIPVPRLCHIAKQMAQALAAAHAANIVHRDLKPDNVMLIDRGTEKDFVKILDFGIAKVGGGTKKMTRAGSVFGTPHYMSPEQAAGAAVDHRTDVYALGVILYEMACGKVPFDADNFMGILTQHMYKAPVPIRALVPEIDIPPGLDAIILKCLTKKPEGRYETMDQLVADLEKLEHGVLPEAVQEMMARSGGFNVPADYFRSTAMPALVPASPHGPTKRWPLYAVMAAVATGVGVVAVVVVGKSASSKAGTRPLTAVAAPSAAPVVTLAPVATTREILVSATPSDAAIWRDGKDLGPQPVALHLAEGEHASLVVVRKGYRSKTVMVDGKDPRVSFALDAVAGPPPNNAAAAKPAPASGSRFGGIDDVGDPFAKH